MITNAMNLNAANASRLAKERAERINPEETEETIVESKSQKDYFTGLVKGVLAKIKNESIAKSESDTPDFHLKELQRKAIDPANGDYLGARAIGLAKASAFIAAAVNTSHKDHRLNFPIFKDVYGMDTKRVEQDFVNQACESMNAFPYDIYDPTYVKMLKAKYRPAPDADSTMNEIYNSFCAELDKKHARVGTRGDAKFVNEFSANYRLPANIRLAEFQQFQPKP